MLRITHNETVYEVDMDRLSIVEARLVKKFTKQAPADWVVGVQKMDPDSIAGLLFLARFRAGEQPKWKDFDNVDLYEVAESLEDLDADQPDPDSDEARAAEYLGDDDADGDEGEDPTQA